MSTSQALGLVGAAVGAYFGGPAGAQFGYAIGSTIGSAIDPDVIRGPDIGDAKQQTSQAGVPIVKAYGMPAPFAGCLIDGDPISRKYIKRERQGKGGPVQESEGFKATRAILVCEGEVNVVRIFRNNKLVFSRIPGDNIDADSAAFFSQIRIYPGSETQLPDPSLEAMHGVGNTPYYRGRCYVVIVDDDETQTAGAANQYLFQVTGCEVTARYLEPGAWVADADAAIVHQLGPFDGYQVAHAVPGTDKMGIVMSPDARHVYVINSSNGSPPYSVSKLSTVDGSIVLTFSITGTPRQIVASPDGEFLYIGDYSDSSVVKYAANGGGEVGRTVGLGNNPGVLAISADGAEVYAGVTGVKVIDTSSMTVTATIAAAAGTISGLAKSPTDTNKLYATVSAASGFLVINLSGSTYVTKSGPAVPFGVCFTPDGTKAYLPNGTFPRVSVVNAVTDTFSHHIIVGALYEAIACSMNGDKLYVATNTFGTDTLQIDVATETVTASYPSVRAYSRRGVAARPLP